MLNGHLLGIYEKAFPNDWSLEKKLTAVKRLGFDFMEISIDESDERIERLYWGKDLQRSLYQLCLDIEIPILTMCLSVHRRFPFGSSKETDRKKAQELMELAIDFAQNTGIKIIQLAGYDVYYEKSTDNSKQQFVSGMKWAAELAEKKLIMLAMEIMDTSLMCSISNFLELQKKIRSPWFKVYPDLGNLSAWGNDVESELTKGIEEIVAVHVKETKAVTPDFPGQFKCVPFGEGCVDFVKCFAKLEELNYKGPYMIEMWNDPKLDNEEEIKQAVHFVKEKYTKAIDKNV